MLKFTILCVLVSHVTAHPDFDNKRIVNGTNAELSDIPSIVSLRNNGIHICGGTILDKNHILTAAQCVNGRKNDTLTIQFGVTNINFDLNIIQVAAIFMHEEFNPSKYNANDVAVLRLAEDIQLAEEIQLLENNIISAVELPEQCEDLPKNKLAELYGWGLDKSGGSMQTELKHVDITLYSDVECSNALENMVDKKYHVCAGIPHGGKGQCNGDSGGPLMAERKQWGIASWSIKPCAVEGYPGVFTRVCNYIDWIEKKKKL